MKPRPIYHLDGEPGFRGGERQLLYLASALRARGREGVVCARAGGELEAQARQQGFETFTGAALAIVLKARRAGAIIHGHTGHAAATAAWASWAGVPAVAHRRVDFSVSALSARLKYGSVGKVICVSGAIADIMKSAGTPASKLVVVPDGLPVTAEESKWAAVPPTRFAPPQAAEREACKKALANEFGFPQDSLLIGNLAALVPHKDHDSLLAAAVIVLLQRPNVKFLIAGRGPEEEQLFESIKRMGMLGKVILMGHRDNPEPILKALDIYVQSSWGEGMGSVLIEAAACGIPIAATTAGGIPEVVEDGATGLLVAPRHPEGMANNLIRLIDKPELRLRLAAEGRGRVSRFGLTRMANEMEEIYDSIA
ncbi:MAG: glycosyltransferase family 4 protein [Elusimicrobiota bacterium]|nr:glycosyltransferase family 4 protein [Elusimicrobiota bacterium]